MSRRPCAPGPDARRLRRRPDQGGPPAGDLRKGKPLRRAPGSRDARTAPDQPAAGADRTGAQGTPAGNQRQPLHPQGGRPGPRRPAVRPDRLAHERPEPVPVLRRGALPQDLARDAGTLPGPPRCVRQHVVDRRTVQRGDPVRQSPASGLSDPGGIRGRGRLPRAPDLRGGTTQVGRRARGHGGGAPGLRTADHQGHGVLVVLPHHLGPHPPRPRAGHPGRPRAG